MAAAAAVLQAAVEVVQKVVQKVAPDDPDAKFVVDAATAAATAVAATKSLGGEGVKAHNAKKEEEYIEAQAAAEKDIRALAKLSSEVEVLRLTEGQAEVGASALRNSSMNMIKFCRGLLAAFSKYDNSNEDFIAFRGKLAEGALAFKETHLPLATFAVNQVSHFLGFYSDIENVGGTKTKLNFEEWSEELPIYIKKLDQLIKVIHMLVSLTEDLRSDIQVVKSDADNILDKFKLEMEELTRVGGQELDAENRARWWKDNIWRYVPALGPVGMLMCNIAINNKANQRLVHELESEKTGLAAQCFKHILVPSAEAFVECMADFAAFFEVLKKDLIIANQSLQDFQDDGPARAHFRVVSKVTASLEAACQEFTKVAPEFRSDLGTVQQLLQTKGIGARDAAQGWLEKPRPGRGQCWKEGLMDMAREMGQLKAALAGDSCFGQFMPITDA